MQGCQLAKRATTWIFHSLLLILLGACTSQSVEVTGDRASPEVAHGNSPAASEVCDQNNLALCAEPTDESAAASEGSKIAADASAAPTTGACESADASHEGQERAIGPASLPTTQWSVDVGVTNGAPAVAGDRLYLSTQKAVMAVDRATGQTVWRSKQRSTISAVAVDDGVVFAVIADFDLVSETDVPEQLVAFSACDGEKLWSQELYVGTSSSPVAHNGTVYIPSGGSLLAFDADTGRLVWETAIVDVAVDGTRPVIASDAVLVLSGTGTLFSIDATNGETVWTQQIEGNSEGSPLVIGDHAYVAVYRPPIMSDDAVQDPSGVLAAMDLATGDVVWAEEQALPVDDPAANASAVFVGRGPVVAQDLETGATAWTSSEDLGSCAPLTATADTVYAVANPSGEEKLVAFDVTDGSVNWEIVTADYDHCPHQSVTAYDGHVYMVNGHGELLALG